MANLAVIQNLKQRKLQFAETNLQLAIRQLSALRFQFEQMEQELERYHIWCVAEEQRLYAHIITKVLRLAQLDEFRERIALIHSNETQLKQRVMELENKVHEAIDHKTQCQNTVRRATKDVEKYRLLMEEIREEAVILDERKSEELLDEFASAKTQKKYSHVDVIH